MISRRKSRVCNDHTNINSHGSSVTISSTHVESIKKKKKFASENVCVACEGEGGKRRGEGGVHIPCYVPRAVAGTPCRRPAVAAQCRPGRRSLAAAAAARGSPAPSLWTGRAGGKQKIKHVQEK